MGINKLGDNLSTFECTQTASASYHCYPLSKLSMLAATADAMCEPHAYCIVPLSTTVRFLALAISFPPPPPLLEHSCTVPEASLNLTKTLVS